MKKSTLSALLALALGIPLGAGVVAQQGTKLAASPAKATVDSPVPNFKLADIMQDKPQTIALSDYAGKKPVILFWMSDKCSVTWRYEKRVGKLMQQLGKKVQFLGVRCNTFDTPDDVKKFAEAKNFDMPLLNDSKGELTRYFNARNTPTFAVIDKKGTLRYFGSFDDAPDEADVTHNYLPEAVMAVLTDKTVPVKQTKSFG
jgi:peroxiredoxin